MQVIVALLLPALTAPRLAAQELHLGVARIWETEPTLEVDPGLVGEFRVGILRRLALTGGFEQYDGKRLRPAPCAGLVSPVGCPTGMTEKHSRLRAWSAGATVALVQRPAISLVLTPALLLGQLSVGHRCQNVPQAPDFGCYRSARDYTGVRLGLEASTRPVNAWPITLVLSGAFGQLVNAEHVRMIDGYDPFVESFSTSRVMLSVAYVMR